MHEKQSLNFDTLLLHAIPNISSDGGGLPVAVLRLLEAIARYSKSTRIQLAASPGQSPLLNKTQVASNLEWLPLSEPSNLSLKQIVHRAASWKSCRESCYLIHDHGIWLPSHHIIASESRRLRIPRIVSPHGMLEPWAWQYKAWKKRIAWYLFQYRDLQKTHVLHATAPSEAMNLREFFPKIPIVTIPLGVEFPPSLETSSSTSNQRTVLFLSRIHEKKGLLNLMEAWSRLNTESWKLIVAGPDEGGYRTVVEQKAIQLGIIDDIQFTGAVEGEAKWNLYREADLFVLPSFSENFGIVVAEALASSTPAIVTKGAPWSDLKSYQCGWWIDIGISPLVEALREAMAMSQAQRTEMGQRGRKLVESKYTWQRAAEQMLDVYEWMLGRKQKPVSIVD